MNKNKKDFNLSETLFRIDLLEEFKKRFTEPLEKNGSDLVEKLQELLDKIQNSDIADMEDKEASELLIDLILTSIEIAAVQNYRSEITKALIEITATRDITKLVNIANSHLGRCYKKSEADGKLMGIALQQFNKSEG